jgi:hypothetical protein
MEFPQFSKLSAFDEAHTRLSMMERTARGNELDQDRVAVEQLAALWQIGFELSRIAKALEESQK